MPIDVKNLFIESAEGEELLYTKSFSEPTRVYRVWITVDWFIGTRARVTLYARDKSDKLIHRQTTYARRVKRMKYSRFMLPEGGSMQLVFYSDGEGSVLEGITIHTEIGPIEEQV